MILLPESFFQGEYQFIIRIENVTTLAAYQMDMRTMPGRGVEDLALAKIVAAGQAFFVEQVQNPVNRGDVESLSLVLDISEDLFVSHVTSTVRQD